MYAKNIANSHRDKLAEETEAKRVKLEARQKRVASRRQHLLHVPRSQRLDYTDWSVEDLRDLQSTLNESATSIQNWWTRNRLSSILKAFSATGVSFASAKALDFKDVISLMQNKTVIQAGSGIIAEVRKMTREKKHWKNPSRVFLSAYMIATHPREAMPGQGPEEEVLETLLLIIRRFKRRRKK